MSKPHLKKSSKGSKPGGKNIPITTKGVAFPLNPNELKNADPLDVEDEMAENVFDRDHES